MASIRYNMKAFRQIRHLLADHVAAKGEAMLASLPDGYSLVVQRNPGSQRPRAIVSALSIEARKDDASNGSLLKAASALRGT